MTDRDHTEFAHLVTQKQLRAVCRSGVQLAQAYFATPLPATLTDALRISGESALTLRLLPRQRRWQMLLADLRLLCEHTLPPAAYLHHHYGTVNRLLLPALYMHRVLRGVCRLWQRPT
jgi:hypothetical protein